MLRRPRISQLSAAAAAALGAAMTLIAASSGAAAQTANLISNPGFENGLSGWSCPAADSATTSPVHSGSSALKGAASDSGDAQCSQIVAVQPNSSYTLSAWVEGSYVFVGDTGTGANDTDMWTPSAPSWQQLSTTFTTGAATTSVTVYVHGWYGQGTYYADDLSLTGPGGSGGGSPPAAPTGLTVTGTTPGSISLSWHASAPGSNPIAGYHVYEGATVVTTVTGTSAAVTGLAASSTHTYTVTAFDTAGVESAHSNAVTATTTSGGGTGSYHKVAYFEQWSIYGNNYSVKNLDTSGVAGSADTLIYAFENIDPVNLTCFEAIKAADTNENDPNAGDGAGDAYADYQKEFDSSTSVNGTADTYSQPLKGNFNQLRELKAKYPNLKILVSLGGWTYSKYFSDVAATASSRQKFVSSCIDMFIKGNLPTGIGGDPSGGPGSAAGIFDGFDIDWEYPASPSGHVGNHYSAADAQNYTLLLQEFRNELDALASQTGEHYQLTAALPAGQDKIDKIQTGQIGQYLDFGDVMTYDMHGSWETNGPTNFQNPLHNSPTDPSPAIPPGNEKYNIDTAITAWTTGLPDYGIPGGFPANKINLGIPFYWRGWTGVSTGGDNGLYQPASGPTPQFSDSQTPGTAFWKELASAGLTGNPADNFYDPTTQSAWIYDGTSFYTGDNPESIAARDSYIRSRGLAGAFVYAAKDDDASATLWNAVVAGLS
jgi:chitinase